MFSADRAAAWPARGSLAGRLIAIVFATSFGLLVTASLALYAGTLSVMQAVDDQFIDKRIAMVAELLARTELDVSALGHEVTEDSHGPRQLFIRILSGYAPIALETPGIENRILAGNFPDAATAALNLPQRATLTLAGGATFRVASIRVPVRGAAGFSDAVIQAATDTTLDRDALAWLRWLLAAVIVAGAPITALASWQLVKRQMKPLTEIAAAAQNIDGATLEYRLDLDGYPSEVRDLGMQFNAMLGRLERTWLDLKTYADTVAHEMRTPLNRLQLRADLALRDGVTLDEMKACLVETVEDCEAMTRLMQALLFLARVDSKQARIAPRQIDVGHELAVIADYFEAPTNAAGISLRTECAGNIVLTADRELIQRALGNLVENALAHTPRNGTISIAATRDAEAGIVAISVSDTGAGIAPADRLRIFERFYRAPRVASDHNQSPASQNSQDAANTGLGLAIAKSIAELHGGTLALECRPGHGATFTLRLPENAAPLSA